MTHTPEWAQRVAREYEQEGEHEESARVRLDYTVSESPFVVGGDDDEKQTRADEVARWLWRDGGHW